MMDYIPIYADPYVFKTAPPPKKKQRGLDTTSRQGIKQGKCLEVRLRLQARRAEGVARIEGFGFGV